MEEIEQQGATPEAVIEPPLSMEDGMRETLREIESRQTESEPAPEASTESTEEKAARIRDAAGKFTPAPVPETAAPAVEPAPNTWKKEASAQWATLPPDVRAEVQRREADFHKGIEAYKQDAGFGQAMNRAITPYAETIQRLGMSPDQAVGELMKTDALLRNGQPHEKIAVLANIARQFGIDLSAVNDHASQQPPVDYASQQRLAALEQRIQYQDTLAQQQQANELNSQIAAFAADPKHSHFPEVRAIMGDLMTTGRATTMEDAYEQAVWANPSTRSIMLQQQEAAAREAATKAAKAARSAASVNVRPRPSMPSVQPIGSMEDTIRATLNDIQGR